MSNMLVIENKAKRWGNSFGIVIPSEVAKKINLKEGQDLVVEIKLKKKIDAFGKFKDAKGFKEESSSHEKFW